MICTFKAHFSAAHFYHQPAWSTQKNQETFGKCFTEYGHGHDYTLEVSLDCDKEQVREIHQVILSEAARLDHQHLNFVIPEFKIKIPTTENVAQYLAEKISSGLQNKKTEAQIIRLRLFESPQVWVEMTA